MKDLITLLIISFLIISCTKESNSNSTSNPYYIKFTTGSETAARKLTKIGKKQLAIRGKLSRNIFFCRAMSDIK